MRIAYCVLRIAYCVLCWVAGSYFASHAPSITQYAIRNTQYAFQARPNEASCREIRGNEENVVIRRSVIYKEGHVRQFTVMSDEGERIGGTDTAPSPLGYFTLGIGF